MNFLNRSQAFISLAFIAMTGGLVLGTAQNASAQYYGGPAFGSRLSITFAGPDWGSPPFFPPPPMFAPPGFGRFAPAYPTPFGMPSRYMARRQAVLETYADAYGLAPVVPVLPVEPLPPVGSFSGSFDLQYDPYAGDLSASAPPSVGEQSYSNESWNSNTQGAFAAAAARLNNSLLQRENGDVWIEYLQSDRLAASASRGQLSADVGLTDLTARYQGVLANPDLIWLQSLDGFHETLAGLNAVTSTEVVHNANEPTVAPELESANSNLEPSTEELPAPAPETQSL